MEALKISRKKNKGRSTDYLQPHDVSGIAKEYAFVSFLSSVFNKP